MDNYWKFYRENYSDICNALRDSYKKHYGNLHERTVNYYGFGSRVAMLFGVIFLIFCGIIETTKHLLLCAALLIITWYMLYLFARSAVHYAYREVFRQREYKEVLSDFVEKKRLEKLSQARTKEEQEVINKEFDYFQHSIQMEIIHFERK